MKRKRENITRGGLLQERRLSGRLLKVSRYLSSHGDKIGNAGQTRRSPPTKILVANDKILVPRLLECVESLFVKFSMRKMPQRFHLQWSSPTLFLSRSLSLHLVSIRFRGCERKGALLFYCLSNVKVFVSPADGL